MIDGHLSRTFELEKDDEALRPSSLYKLGWNEASEDVTDQH